MLTGIRLRNFKCFEDLNLEKLGRINVFIGPNGSGKSSVLQALMALRQSLGTKQLMLTGPFVDLGGYQYAVFAGDRSRQIGIGIGLQRELATGPVVADYDVIVRESDGNGRNIQNLAVFRWQGSTIPVEWQGPGGTSPGPDLILGSIRAQTQGSPGTGTPLSFSSKSDDSTDQSAQGYFEEFSLSIRSEIESWRFSTTTRGFTQAAVVLGDKKLLEIHPSAAVESVTTGIASTLVYEAELIAAQVNEWVRKVTDVSVSAQAVEGKRVAVSVDRGTLRIPVTAEGFGTNQLAFVFFVIAVAPPGSMVALEEPEIHLHPYAIARLGDLLVEIARDRELQLIMTTHSEYLLLNLLNNVAEGKLEVDDLGVYYFEREDEGCIARKVGITPRGMVEGGLPGFFDASLEAQRRHMAALAPVS